MKVKKGVFSDGRYWREVPPALIVCVVVLLSFFMVLVLKFWSAVRNSYCVE